LVELPVELSDGLFAQMKANTAHPFLSFNMGISETEPATIGTALVLCQEPLSPEIYDSLMDALAKVGLLVIVHHGKSSSELRDIVRRTGWALSGHASSFDLFLCLVVGEGGRFVSADGVSMDLRGDLVAGINGNASESSATASNVCSCIKVFLSNTRGGADQRASIDDPFTVVVTTSDEAVGTLSGPLLVTSLVAALEEQLQMLPDPAALNLQRIVDSLGERTTTSFEVQTREASAAKIVMQPNVRLFSVLIVTFIDVVS
jgi:hypothetical protein